MVWIRSTYVDGGWIAFWCIATFFFTLILSLPFWLPPAPAEPPITEECYKQKSPFFVEVELDHPYDEDNCKAEIEKMLGYGFTNIKIESGCKGYCNSMWMFKEK